MVEKEMPDEDGINFLPQKKQELLSSIKSFIVS
jgi:hypothetical protein